MIKAAKVFVLLLAGSVINAQKSSDARLDEVKTIDAHTPKEIQIQLAESAAPHAITQEADIYVLGAKGYELARKGSNGFSCIVDRQLPNTLEPECFDAEGTATTLKTRFFTETQRAQGVGEDAIQRAVESGYKAKRFQAPRRPGIVYMLSDHNYVFDPEQKKIIHFPGHLMFYAPYLTEK